MQCDISQNFGAQGLHSWGSHFWIILCDGPSLSGILIWCQVPSEKLTVCFDPNFPLFTLNRFSRIRTLRYTTQLCRLLQQCNWSFCTTFLWLLAGRSFYLNMSEMAFVAIYVSFFRLVILTHGRMPELTWRFFFTEFESAWNFTLAQRAFLFIAWSLWGFLSLAVSLFCLRMGCRRRRSSFFASDLCHCFLVLVCHDWNYMGLLWNIVHVPSNESTLPLSSQRRLVTAPLSTTSFRTLKFRVLIMWQIWSFTGVFNRK